MNLLPQETIQELLAALPYWELDGDRIVRKLEFPTFMEAIAFINRIAALAECADHHPEIFNVYNRVELVLTTHDAKGITTKDTDLAGEIDLVVGFD